MIGLTGFGSLRWNLIEALVLTVCDDSYILLFGAGDQVLPKGRRLLPAVPGWVIGIVWLVFFLWMAFEYANLRASATDAAVKAAIRLRALLLGAAAYPFYTLGLRNAGIGFCGNIVMVGLAAIAFIHIRRIRFSAAALPVAMIAWLIFASLLILDSNHWFW